MILLSFCDLVHVQSVVDLLAKQLYNGVERSERAQNHKQTGKITKNWALDGPFSTNARLDVRARI